MSARTVAVFARCGLSPKGHRTRPGLVRLLLNRAQAGLLSIAATAVFAFIVYK